MIGFTWLVALSIFAVAACANPETDRRCVNTSANHPILEARIVATSCTLPKDRYEVSLKLYKDEQRPQEFQFEAEGVAYQPTVDFSLDINADGLADVAVATGKGRAGDGMHYWLVLTSPTRLVDAGEAPQLAWSSAGTRILFALIPGSGEIQSTRMDYELRGGRLAPVHAHQFKMRHAGGFEMISLHPHPGDPSRWNTSSSKNVSDEAAQDCMSGGSCP